MARRRWVPLDDPHRADWLTPAVTGYAGGTVASVVPAAYDAHVEIGTWPAGAALRELAGALERHTTTPENCWFTMWEGYSQEARALEGSPTFSQQGLEHFLFHGSVGDLVGLAEFLVSADQDDATAELMIAHGNAHVPTRWWPEDRAWVAGWHIDAAYVVVAGSTALAGDLLAAATLAAVPSRPDAPLRWG